MSSGRSAMRWQDTIQFRFSLGVAIILLAMATAIYGAVHFFAKDFLVNKNKELINETGSLIVSELSRQISVAESLTRTLAQAGENLPKDPQLFFDVIPEILNITEYQDIVAGGGIWPEPEQFTPGVERRSFFWGRDGRGQLRYFDQYNRHGGAGYHHEEWYVPARHSPPGECIWSKSYKDPYSFEPMVTCTVAMFSQKEFSGNATVDIKLKKLQQFLQESSAKLGGYAFAVDRSNKFLSFPNEKLSSVISSGDKNNLSREFFTVTDLASMNNLFKPVADILNSINLSLVKNIKEKDQRIAEEIARDSYQISESEALLIAANISVLRNKNGLRLNKNVSIAHQQDLLLDEPVLISIFLMPKTMWKIVVVTPQSLATVSAENAASMVMLLIITVLISTGGLGFIYFRRSVINPIYKMANQLQRAITDNSTAEVRLLEDRRQDEIGMLAHYFNQSTLALDNINHNLQLEIKERNQAEQKLKHMALHDSLTNLPNRTLFQDRLVQAIAFAKRNHKKFALFFVDLDNFKIINDTLGHEIGDKLLQQVAKRVTEADREIDTVARLGGDEFAFIINKLKSIDDAMVFAQRLNDLFNAPIKIDNNVISVGISIGITVFPDDATNIKELLRNADIAMYQAKADGRNTTRFFVNDMNIKLQKSKQILSDLTISLKQDEFELYYQPQFSIDNGELIGAEALIRWHHPEKGMIPPIEFIPVAEQSGLINELGDWVLTQACRQINAFNNAGLPSLTIAVNISPVQFRHKNFVQNIQTILEQHGVLSRYIELEITESAVMDNVENAIIIMQTLHDSGFQLSIDDFGTGYSSLSYLKRFPIQKIKIDRSFISDIEHDEDSQAIATAIIQMGHSLGLKVLAEGAENEAQLRMLHDKQCDFVQGYYRGRPMPAGEFIERYSFVDYDS